MEDSVIKPVMVDSSMLIKVVPAKSVREAAQQMMHLYKRVTRDGLFNLGERCSDAGLTVREQNESLRLAWDILSDFHDITGKYMGSGVNGMKITPDMIVEIMAERHIDSVLRESTARISELEAELAAHRRSLPPDASASPRSEDEPTDEVSTDDELQ